MKTANVLSSHEKKGVWQFVGVVAVLVAWCALSYLRLVDPVILPPPGRVILAASDVGFALFFHVLATLLRVVSGFLTAVVIGGLIGISMQYSRITYAVLDGPIESMRPVPAVALVPFFILLFGFSEGGRLALVVIGTSLVIVITVIEALNRVPPAYIQYGLTIGLTRRRIFREILIPAAIPNAKAGFRVALALTFTLVIVSEFLGSQFGLGYLINVSKVTLTTSTMLLCIILLGGMGYLLDFLIRGVFAYASRWEHSSEEATR